MRWAIYFFAIAVGFAGTATNADKPVLLPAPAPAYANQQIEKDKLVRLQFDSMEFSGNALRFVNDRADDGKNEAGKLPRRFMLEGESRFSIADGDVVIVADNISVVTDGSEPISITADGSCEYADGGGEGVKATADRIKFGRSEMSFEGKVRFEGEQGITIRADSVNVMEPLDGHARLQINGAAEVTLPEWQKWQ